MDALVRDRELIAGSQSEHEIDLGTEDLCELEHSDVGKPGVVGGLE